MTTALITGGNGNLGRRVAARLLAAGQEVVSVDRPGTEPAHTEPGISIVSGDVRDGGLLRDAVETHRPDTIYHLASLLSGSSETDLRATWDINASASFELLDLAHRHGVGRFFFASSIATYAAVDADPMPLDYPQWPVNLYGATKVAVERAGTYFKLRHGLDFRCLRFPLVISPDAPPGAVSAFPSHAFRAAFNGEPFTFPVAQSTGVSTLFIEDVIDSIVDYVAADASRLREHAYNLHAFYLSAGMVAAEAERRFPGFDFRFEPLPESDQLIGGWPDHVDDSAARRDWGWNPRYDFDASAACICELLAHAASNGDS